MIVSMTGFGKAAGQFEGKKLTVEIKSLNSKQGDFIVRMPSVYKEKELVFRTLLANLLHRGKIELSVYSESNGEESQHTFNKELAINYYNELKEVAEAIGQESQDYLAQIVRMPDVLKVERPELKEDEAKFLQDLIEEAIEQVNGFRKQEGEKLQQDFNQRIVSILSLLKEVEKHDPKRIEGIRERITKNLEEILTPDKADYNRHEQELIYYIEKLDITEEKVRLKAHCDYFMETMEKSKTQGKKLGFIAQEIGREINTIGSKANYAEIQRAVVQMKDELEKIKEQVLNVL